MGRREVAAIVVVRAFRVGQGLPQFVVPLQVVFAAARFAGLNPNLVLRARRFIAIGLANRVGVDVVATVRGWAREMDFHAKCSFEKRNGSPRS